MQFGRAPPTRQDEIHNLLSQLAPHLPHDALLNKLTEKHVPIANLNELGHAYYNHYYNRAPPSFAPLPRPSSSSIVASHNPPRIRLLKLPDFVRVTDHVTPAHDACNIVHDAHYIMKPEDFIRALKNIHPTEMTGAYYHNEHICDVSFESILMRVNDTVISLFKGNQVIHVLQKLLSGIEKCMCLRVLSRNAYYYGHRAAHLIHDQDQAMQE